MAITVDAFEWDEENENHCAKHGLTPSIAAEVRSRSPLFFLNKKGKTGSHLMIGPSRRGRFWTIVILKKNDNGLWRPITGWPSSVNHMQLYEAKSNKLKH